MRPSTKTLSSARSRPKTLARAARRTRKLADPALRKALWDGGMAAVKASDDPMIQFVLATDAAARAHPQGLRGARRRPDRPRRRAHRQGALRRLRHQRLSGRDLLAAPLLRQGRGLDRAAAATVPPFTYFAGLFDARHRPAAVRAGAALDRGARASSTPTPCSTFVRQRHHRRQFRLAADQRQGRGDRRDLRRQHPFARRRLRLRPGAQPRGRGLDRGDHRGADQDLWPGPRWWRNCRSKISPPFTGEGTAKRWRGRTAPPPSRCARHLPRKRGRKIYFFSAFIWSPAVSRSSCILSRIAGRWRETFLASKSLADLFEHVLLARLSRNRPRSLPWHRLRPPRRDAHSRPPPTGRAACCAGRRP